VTSHDTEESRTPVELSVATWSDPHMQPAARHPATVERLIGLSFFAGLVAFGAFGAAFWQNWAPWSLGASLGFGMLFIGTGMVAWGKYLMPRGPFVEDRHPLGSPPDEVEAFTNALMERGVTPVKRRRVLGGLLGAGMGIFAVVAAFPLLRSLGPVPKNTLATTDWTAGTYLVDQQGRRVQQDELAPGSVLTVFPEGTQNSDRGQAVDQTILIRVAQSPFSPKKGKRHMNDIPAGYVAYSKLCTHLGCPVGLYERALELLVCPCHQSMFDVTDHALPIFGPAPRPLPQLPLAIDADGYLYAKGTYNQPVGPGYWTRA
jgi:ubiquinol-cytochrome c reductase iron-sulfur subunit